jgi:hypothetical protein
LSSSSLIANRSAITDWFLSQPEVLRASVEEALPGRGCHNIRAYVQLKDSAFEPLKQGREKAQLWSRIFDLHYAKSENVDPTFDIGVWKSSYTGQAIPEEEMREWVSSTAA